jgi:hypothetical protein
MQNDALRHQRVNRGLDRGTQLAGIERLDDERLWLIGGRVALFDSLKQRRDRHGNHDVFGERILQPGTGSLDPERVAGFQRSIATRGLGQMRVAPDAGRKQPQSSQFLRIRIVCHRNSLHKPAAWPRLWISPLPGQWLTPVSQMRVSYVNSDRISSNRACNPMHVE